MNTVQESAVGHYLAKGLSKDVAVGLVAVLYVESALKPGSQGIQSTETPGALNPSGAYGIASWNGPRQQALADFATKKNLDPSQLNTQLDFVLTECANSYPTVWTAIQNTGISYIDFIKIMVSDYERPKDAPGEIARAITVAEDIYPHMVEPISLTPPLFPSAPFQPPAPPAPIAPVAPRPVLTTPMDPVAILELAQSLLAWLIANQGGPTKGKA